jgi:hypothetical protein
MYQATAAEFIPLPNIEIKLAAKTKRNGRWLRMARIFTTLAEVESGWNSPRGHGVKE